MAQKTFGLLLTEDGVRELEPVLKDYWEEGSIGKFIYCKEANPDRNYFHIVAVAKNGRDSDFEADIYIPHRFIRIVVSGTDKKSIGFL